MRWRPSLVEVGVKVIRVADWDTLQHYKKRGAPWCKLYRRDLELPRYRALPFDARGLLADLYRMAVETDNLIPLAPEVLAFQLGVTEPALASALQALVGSAFVVVLDVASQQDASRNASSLASKNATGALTSLSQSLDAEDTTREESDASKSASKNASKGNGKVKPDLATRPRPAAEVVPDGGDSEAFWDEALRQ